MSHVPYSKSQTEKRTPSKRRFFFVDGKPSGLPFEDIRDYTYGSTFSGFKNPDWKRNIRDSTNATTIANGSKVKVSSVPTLGHFDIDKGGGHYDRYQVQGDCAEIAYLDNQVSLAGTLPFDEISNSALTQFLKKCKAAQRQFSTGVFAGELRETLHLIKNPASAFRKLLDDYVLAARRRSRGLSPRRQASLVANQWLEYSFGMVPLLSDIRSGYDALERLYFNLPSKRVSSIFVRPYWGYVDQMNVDLFSGAVPALLLRSAKRTGGRKIVGSVSIRQKELAPYQALGLGLDEFIPTVYELIPYSFLVDYFTNIGDLLEVFSFNQTDLLWYCSSVFSEDLEVYSIQPRRTSQFAGDPVIGYSLTPGTYVKQSKTFARSVPVPLGLPSLAFKLPGNWSKFLNIGALALSRTL